MLIEKDRINLGQLQSKYQLQHLKPPPEIYQIMVPQNQYFIQIDSNSRRRRIFYRVPYEEKEQESIREVRKKEAEYNIYEKFPDEVILKHLYAGAFDIDKVMIRLSKLQQFHNNPLITNFTEKTLKKLKDGCIYTYGHDKNFKPIVIIQTNKFDTTLSIQENYNIVYFLMLVVLGYRNVPYHAQKYVCIFDLNNASFSQIPKKYLFELTTTMGIYYSGNVERTYIYNAKGISLLWAIGSKFIPQHAKKKIKFIESGRQNEVLQNIDPYELQKKYGGKLQNLEQYWPPKSTNQEFDRFGMQGDEDSTVFYSVNNLDELFVQKQQSLCGKASCQCIIF